jgi:hypothetical protein
MSATAAFILGMTTALLGTLAVVVPLVVKIGVTECKGCKELDDVRSQRDRLLGAREFESHLEGESE